MNAVKVTVGTAATEIVPAGGHVDYPRAALILVPSGGVTVYIGGPTVTVEQGYPIGGGESLAFDIVNEAVYAIVSAATQDVHVLRRG